MEDKKMDFNGAWEAAKEIYDVLDDLINLYDFFF